MLDPWLCQPGRLPDQQRRCPAETLANQTPSTQVKGLNLRGKSSFNCGRITAIVRHHTYTLHLICATEASKSFEVRLMTRSLLQATRVAAMALTLFSASAALAQRDTAMPPSGQNTANGLLARQGDGSFGPVIFDRAKAPFGLRANNWVAIKGPNLKGRWPGQTGATTLSFARFDDPAYSIRSFIELMRIYQTRHNARSATDILKRYSPAGDCSGAPSLSPSKRREGGGCVENQTTPPVSAVRAARAVGLQPTDNLDLFGPNGQINHPDRMRALLDAVVTQEIGASHCPQPPRGESWIGCRVDDGIYNRAVELLERRG